MAYDANIILQNPLTVTASGTGATAVVLVGGTPRRGLKARVTLMAVGTGVTSGDKITPYLQVSTDNIVFNTYINQPVGGGKSTPGDMFLPFDDDVDTYFRLGWTYTGLNATPFTIKADIGLARP